jgi:hypothetical protein
MNLPPQALTSSANSSWVIENKRPVAQTLRFLT